MTTRGSATKRQRLVVVEFWDLARLWETQIAPFACPKSILALIQTCRFFNEMFAPNKTDTWLELCKTHSIDISQPFHPWARLAFISNTLSQCVRCHKHTLEHDRGLLALHLHAGCLSPCPVMGISKVKSEFHISPEIIHNLPRITLGTYRCQFVLVEDVRKAAYAYYGSKEAWEIEHVIRIVRREATKASKRKKKEDQLKQAVDNAVAFLGPEFASDRWHGYWSIRYVEQSIKPRLSYVVETEIRQRILDLLCGWDPAKSTATTRWHQQNLLLNKWKHANPEKYQLLLHLFKQGNII